MRNKEINDDGEMNQVIKSAFHSDEQDEFEDVRSSRANIAHALTTAQIIHIFDFFNRQSIQEIIASHSSETVEYSVSLLSLYIGKVLH